MIAPPERSAERDEAILAALPFVADRGWNVRTAMEAAGPDADLLFPGGAADMVEAYIDLSDRRMLALAAETDMAGLRVPARVRQAIALRLADARDDKLAIARALGVLAMPQHAALAARTLARTTDAVWTAAGDDADGLSWYTKRLTLAPIYAATLLYWLRDDGMADEATLAFLDRRLAGVGRITRLRKRMTVSAS